MSSMKPHYNNHGQTLIELIVASAVILISLAAFLGMSVSTYSGAVTSQEYVIASNLAREGIELVRNIRDSNFLQENAFNLGLDVMNSPYKVDYLSGLVSLNPDCPDENNMYNDACRLSLDSDNDVFYNHIPQGNQTKYYRIIKITDIDSAHILVESWVKWKSKKGEESVNMRADLYDWY